MSIYVSNVPVDVTAENLLEVFSKFGSIDRISPIKSSQCVVYKHNTSAQDLLYKGDPGLHMPTRRTVCGTRLSKEQVQKFGAIEQYYYPDWKICYRSFEDAQNAINMANGKKMKESRISVTHDPDTLLTNSTLIEALIRRMYNQPVMAPEKLIWKGTPYTFIQISELPNLNIIEYSKEPAFQVWAGPPGTRNEIITVEDSGRRKYLVRGIWSEVQKEILQPIETSL